MFKDTLFCQYTVSIFIGLKHMHIHVHLYDSFMLTCIYIHVLNKISIKEVFSFNLELNLL